MLIVVIVAIVIIFLMYQARENERREAREAAARDREDEEYRRAGEAERRASGMSPEEWKMEKAERAHDEWLERQGGAKKYHERVNAEKKSYSEARGLDFVAKYREHVAKNDFPSYCSICAPWGKLHRYVREPQRLVAEVEPSINYPRGSSEERTCQLKAIMEVARRAGMKASEGTFGISGLGASVTLNFSTEDPKQVELAVKLIGAEQQATLKQAETMAAKWDAEKAAEAVSEAKAALKEWEEQQPSREAKAIRDKWVRAALYAVMFLIPGLGWLMIFYDCQTVRKQKAALAATEEQLKEAVRTTQEREAELTAKYAEFLA